MEKEKLGTQASSGCSLYGLSALAAVGGGLKIYIVDIGTIGCPVASQHDPTHFHMTCSERSG